MFDIETIIIFSWGILGIAGLLLALSRMKSEKRLDWRIGIGIPLFGVSLFVLTTELPQYGIGFSILGTLIMAGAALMAIKQRDEQVRIDRRERKLITIIEWATDIAKCETAVPMTPLPIMELFKSGPGLGKVVVDEIIKSHNTHTRADLIMRYQNIDARGKRIVLISKTLDKQFSCNLGDLAHKTAKKLEAHGKLGWKWIPGEITDKEYKRRWKSLVKSAMSLAEKAEEVVD